MGLQQPPKNHHAVVLGLGDDQGKFDPADAGIGDGELRKFLPVGEAMPVLRVGGANSVKVLPKCGVVGIEPSAKGCQPR